MMAVAEARAGHPKSVAREERTMAIVGKFLTDIESE
ncbi:hypothetical protein ACRB68_31440 [Actinomadura sp. RB68]|uniref:Uncharacterized protein n=1 Tax=Actinomadura macrotermitis TaxID=2585200 RepID=A0A7K0BV50_9ACTN|nr:hypothetical protein [Actinomadura macrotermitis]